jgi:cytochrome c-type biogenesis protein CcmF
MDTASYRNVTVQQGDTLYYSNGFIIFSSVEKNPQELLNNKFNSDEQSLFFHFTVQSKYGRQYKAMPGLAFKDTTLRLIVDTVPQENLALKFNKLINPQNNSIEIGIKESPVLSELITLKVYEFPWITLLWTGVIVMSLGFMLAIYQRVKKASTNPSKGGK